MNALEPKLKIELESLFAAHSCSVTDAMILKRDAQVELLPKIKRMKDLSFTVYDLNQARFIYHSSAHDKWLNKSCIGLDEEDSGKQLWEMTHPDDKLNALKIKLNAYNNLMDLPAEKRPDFSFQYLRRIKDNQGGFQLYIHRVSVMICDDNSIPWLLLIITERLPEYCSNELCMEDTYKLLSLSDNAKGLSTDEIRMTDHQLNILGMVYDGHNNQKIASKLSISNYTILGHYSSIRKRLHINSIQMASIYAKIIGILHVFSLCWIM